MDGNSSLVGIIGSGGQADEVQSYLEGSVAFRAVDAEYKDEIASVDVKSPNEQQRNTPIVAAIGAPAVRREMIEKWPGVNYATVISPHAVIDNSVKIVDGCIVAPGVVLTTNVVVGKHTIVNVTATVGHNTVIGDYVTIGPGANIAGNVVLGNGVFIGIGAAVINDITIAAGVVIGAGAVVVKDIIEENSVYVGVPAKKINQKDGWLRAV